MALLDDAKKAVRISAGNTAFNGEIEDLIAAAQADLFDSGITETVAKADEPVPAIKRAIIVYCKAHFGFNNPDADRLQQVYEKMAAKLALTTGYREEGTDAVE